MKNREVFLIYEKRIMMTCGNMQRQFFMIEKKVFYVIRLRNQNIFNIQKTIYKIKAVFFDSDFPNIFKPHISLLYIYVFAHTNSTL